MMKGFMCIMLMVKTSQPLFADVTGFLIRAWGILFLFIIVTLKRVVVRGESSGPRYGHVMDLVAQRYLVIVSGNDAPKRSYVVFNLQIKCSKLLPNTTCHSDLGNKRCLALEKVAKSLELPCRHQALGCHDIFSYYSNIKTEQSCRFRPYRCPYTGSECTIKVLVKDNVLESPVLGQDCLLPMGITSENVAQKFNITKAETRSGCELN